MKITVVMLWTTFVKIPDNDSCQILPSSRIYLGLKSALRMFKNDREGQTLPTTQVICGGKSSHSINSYGNAYGRGKSSYCLARGEKDWIRTLNQHRSGLLAQWHSIFLCRRERVARHDGKFRRLGSSPWALEGTFVLCISLSAALRDTRDS